MPESTALKHLSGASIGGPRIYSVSMWKNTAALHVTVKVGRYYPEVTDGSGYQRFSVLDLDLLKWGRTYASLDVQPGILQAECEGNTTRIPISASVVNGQTINVAVSLTGLAKCGLTAGATVSAGASSFLMVEPSDTQSGPGFWLQSDFDAAVLKL